MKDRLIFISEIFFILICWEFKAGVPNIWGPVLRSGLCLFIVFYVIFGIDNKLYKLLISAFHVFLAVVFSWDVLGLRWFYDNYHVIYCLFGFFGLTLSIDLLQKCRK